jgi:hypothetical protein
MKIPEIIFKGNDILVSSFLRRYLDKARRVPGYENQVKYIESILLEIQEASNNGMLPEIPLKREEP